MLGPPSLRGQTGIFKKKLGLGVEVSFRVKGLFRV